MTSTTTYTHHSGFTITLKGETQDYPKWDYWIKQFEHLLVSFGWERYETKS